MTDRQLKVVVSADIHQYQQAMTLAASTANSFQSALGHAGASVTGFQQAATHAGSAVQGVGSAQQHAAQQINQANQQISSSNDRAGNSFASFAKRAVAIVGVGAAIKSTIKAGADFQSSLNTLGAVSGASAAQLKKVGDTARQLGNDIEIPGASAATAADAMTELAKGGLSVQQSMAAAKGTLQLAAAAQIDGAQAAEIQAKAINTFGLAGKDAAHVGDVLANTANAASGEITDFAAAIAQGGLVAHSMGLSIDETSTALGIFANQGLVGSDAGTSLKTMLVSLQSPTKQQAAALATLGVKAFDAQGNFVGMRTITEELSAAQKDLTQEQYAAAASTAFGTDAVRAAVAVAAGGTEAWDNMAAAVSKAGGAQELAAAQMKGLKGAFSLVENAVQDAQIALFDQLSPALETATRGLADMVPVLATALVPALGTAGQAVIGIAQSAMPLLVSAADAIAPAFTIAGNGISSIVPIITPVIGLIGDVASTFAGLPGPIQTAALAFGLMAIMRNKVATATTAITSRLRSTGSAFALMGRQISFLKFQGMSAGMATMAVGLRGIGTAAATAGRGMMAAFGGPVGLAIIGITTALSIFSSKSAEASQRTQEFNDRSKELADTLDKTTGKLSDDTTAKIVEDFGNVAGEFDAVGLKAGDAAQAIIDYGKGNAGAKAHVDAIRESIFKTTNVLGNNDINSGMAAQGLKSYTLALGDVGISYEQMQRAALGGNDAIAAMATKIAAAGGDYNVAAQNLRDYRGQAEGAVPALRSLNAEQDVVSNGMKVSAEFIKAATDAALRAAGAYSGQLSQAMKDASASGASLEEALTMLGVPAKEQEAIMAALAPRLTEVGKQAHYLTPEAAGAAQALGITGDKAGATAGNLDRLKGSVPTSALQALHGDSDKAAGSVGALAGAADDAEPAVGSFAEAMTKAKDPAGGLKSALDDVKTAADNVSAASDLMAAAVLRAQGIDLTAEQAARENAAALRGVTEGILEKKRAATDNVRVSQDQAQAVRDEAQAERDLKTARENGRKTDKKGNYTETDVEFTQRIADGEQKVADAKRKVADAARAVQDQALKTAAAQTADQEAFGKAATSALDMANKSGLAALATGSVEKASKAAQKEIGNQRKAFIDAAVAAGVSKDAAKKLADQYGLTPKAVKTSFEAQIADAEKNGTHLYQVYDKTSGQWTAQFLTKDDAAARLKAGDTLKAYDKTKGTWTGKITADNVDALDKMEATQRKVDSLTGKEIQITYKGVIVTNDAKATSFGGGKAAANAAGGYQVGPGTGTSDSILSWLSNGEYVVNAKATAKHRPLLDRINSETPAFSTGGFMGNRGKEINYGIVGSSAGAPDFAAMLATGAAGMAKAAGAALSKLVPPMPPVTSGVAQWLPLAQKVFAEKGAPFSAIPIMMAQMQNESGGNPRAINLWDINAKRGTPSKGLLQFIDPTFRAYADPGFNTNIWDPESQMRAFINYVPARYGSFSYLTRIGNKAYAEGGPVVGIGSGTSDSNLARVSNGEFIVNAASTAKYRGWLDAINNAPGYASGGLVGASALAGISPRSLGDREGLVSSSLADVLSFVKDLQRDGRDMARTAQESAKAARQAILDQRAQAETTKEASADAAEKLADAKRQHAEDVKAHKDAPHRLAANKELAKAQAEYDKAIAATNADLQAANVKVSATRKQAAADEKAAAAAKKRGDAEGSAYNSIAKARAAQLSHARALDADTTALAANREKLAGLKEDRASAIAGMAGSIVSIGSGLTGFASERTTPDAILKGLRSDLASEKAFGANLAKLQKGGLSSDSLQELIGKGADGVAVAATLANASPTTLKYINQARAQIAAQANTIAARAVSPQTDRTIAVLANQVKTQGQHIDTLVKFLRDNGVEMVHAMRDAAAAPMKALTRRSTVKAGQH